MSDDLALELEGYGALASQIVDLEQDGDPRILRYLDLRHDLPGQRRPVIVESGGEPRLHVFDAQTLARDGDLERWCMRVVLRGDGAWVGVLEPGRLRLFRPNLVRGAINPLEVGPADAGRSPIPAILYDTTAGEKDLPARQYLLRLLDRSIENAIGYGLTAHDALSLVGRGLFWRFLFDRGLLDTLEPRDVCPGADRWPRCLDDKARALRTFDWLDETFNGGLLPFDVTPGKFDERVFERVLGNVAHGGTASGQLRLPTDWSEVNFAHIPVGLLSEVYEAFAHARERRRARAESIHYTPRRVAEFLVSEALAPVPLDANPRLLDPAAGAGIFLVIALRRLAERRWQALGRRPNRQQLRRILMQQLTGFDTDPSALRLAELALYLTALDLDPDPRPPKALRFAPLRDTVLHRLEGGPDDGSLDPVPDRFRGKFDLVVGNPPWTAKSRGGTAKRQWVKNSLATVRERLGADRARSFMFPDTNPDLPFVWRAVEWAKPGGSIALVTHARWLFGLSDRLQNARRDLLQAVRVTGVLNGSALRLTSVWPNVSAPFCLLFAVNETPPHRSVFQFVSPALDTPRDAEQTRMRIDWLDADSVSVAEVLDKPWALKARFRGNRLAERVLEAMNQGTPLSDYLASLGTQLRNGYQVGRTAGKQVSAKAIQGLPDLRPKSKPGFVVDVNRLPRFSRRMLLFPRDRANYRAPLLLVHKRIPTDPLKPRALRSEYDLAYSESFHGASFADVSSGSAIVRYLQLVLQSSATVLFELLCDAIYGVERDVVYLESLERVPVVPFADLDRSHTKRVADLSARIASGMDDNLAREIDELVFDLHGLSRVEREAVEDTVATALPSTRSKRDAAGRPTSDGRSRFVATLSRSLDDVLSASGARAWVRPQSDSSVGPWSFLQVDITAADERETPTLIELPATAILETANESGASLITVRAGDTTWIVGLLARSSLWTRTRARLLATDLLTERDDGR